jgi:hypothetical protein
MEKSGVKAIPLRQLRAAILSLVPAPPTPQQSGCCTVS